MQSNTHAACGLMIGSALTLTQPNEYFVLGLSAAFVGSIISDIDVGDVGKKTTPVILSVASSLTTIVTAVIAMLMLPELSAMWFSQSNIIRSLVGVALFILTCIYGASKPHRSFMHSFIALFVLSFAVYLILPTAAVYFFAGFVSHQILDIINYRPVMLYYPSEKGFSLKLCKSKSRANTAMLAMFCLATIALLVVRYFLRYKS